MVSELRKAICFHSVKLYKSTEHLVSMLILLKNIVTNVFLSSCVTLTSAVIGWNKHTSNNKKKYEVRTSLYGLNKANQYLTSEVFMDDDYNGGKDDYSQ